MAMNLNNGKVIPLINISFPQGIMSPTVREAMKCIRGVCPQEGTVVYRVIEQRPRCGGRLTTILVRSMAAFDAEEAAMAWWARMVSRSEELPHRQLLVEPLSQMSLVWTTPEILDLLRRRNGRGNPRSEAPQKRRRGAWDVVFSNAEETGRSFSTAEDPGETRRDSHDTYITYSRIGFAGNKFRR